MESETEVNQNNIFKKATSAVKKVVAEVKTNVANAKTEVKQAVENVKAAVKALVDPDPRLIGPPANTIPNFDDGIVSLSVSNVYLDTLAIVTSVNVRHRQLL